MTPTGADLAKVVVSADTTVEGQALARAIRARREQLGMSQDQLACRSGKHRQLICRLENGHNLPTFPNLVIIARALRWSLPDLASAVDRHATTIRSTPTSNGAAAQ